MNKNNCESISDKLGLGPDVRELKFGYGFTGGGSQRKGENGFHTIRYDFKPASVDGTQQGKLEVDSNNQVTIALPHSEGLGLNVFKGPRKPYLKECVLIVDHETGEVTLEKLTHNITVKKTREEGGSRGGGGGGSVVNPPSHQGNQGSAKLSVPPEPMSRKMSPVSSSMINPPPRHHPHSPLTSINSPSADSISKPLKSTKRQEKDKKQIISAPPPSKPAHQMPSLSSIEDLIPVSSKIETPTNLPPTNIISEPDWIMHSSSSSSSASSSSSSSSSSSEDEDDLVTPTKNTPISTTLPKNTNFNASNIGKRETESESEDDDDDLIDAIDSIPIGNFKNLPLLPSHKSELNSKQLLSQDLRLSEESSDSD